MTASRGYGDAQRNLRWMQVLGVLFAAGLLLAVGLFLASGVGSAQSVDQQNATHVGNATVTVEDADNESVWVDLEFADDADSSNAVKVDLNYSDTLHDNETVYVDPGNVTTVTLNGSIDGTYTVEVYADNGSDVQNFTVGIDDGSDGDAAAMLGDMSLRENIVIVVFGVGVVLLVVALLVGARREGTSGRY